MTTRTLCAVALLMLAACGNDVKTVDAPSVSAGRDAIGRYDYPLALGNLIPLARQGNAEAQYRLGYLYVYGAWRPNHWSRSEGVDWIRKSADQGYVDAEYDMGKLYENGTVVAQNDAEAIRWYRLAADKDRTDAQVNLAYLADLGRGMPQDFAESLKWDARAAEQANRFAIHNIAYAYAQGQGVPQSDKEALYWYTVEWRYSPAGAAQNTAAQMRDQYAGKLPASEVQQVMASALMWSPGKGSTDKVRRDAKLPTTGDGSGGLMGSGSGVVIARNGNVLTAAHVVHECHKLTVKLAGGASVPAEVLAQDTANDVAVIKSGIMVATPAKLRDSAPRLGESVAAAGFPLGPILDNDLNLSNGTVSALSGIQDDTSTVQISAAVQQGDSGGPVFDGNGNVLGVISHKLNALGVAIATGDIPQNLSYAVKSSVVRQFLDTKGISYETSVGKPMSSTDVATVARAITVKIECAK